MLVENFNYLPSQLQKSEVFEHIKANGLKYDSLRKEGRTRERHKEKRQRVREYYFDT
jgi:hypothetical protein